jgi:hypothetical protein
MLRYKLRTLLMLMAVGPPVVAGVWMTVQGRSGQRRPRGGRLGQ